MKKTAVSSIVFLLFIAGCVNNASDEPTPVVVKRTGKKIDLCYILCDFSASQGKPSRNKIIQNADSIFKVARASHFKFIDISSPFYKGPFYEYKPPKYTKVTPRDEWIRQKVLDGEADSLHSKMIHLSNAPSAPKTCIIKSLEKVASSLAAIADSTTIIRIVLLSDMLEDCTFNGLNFDIDQGNYKDAFATLARMDRPFSTFTGYKNLEITLVASSERNINTTELNRFWQAVFKNYDYNLQKPISTELPSWLLHSK